MSALSFNLGLPALPLTEDRTRFGELLALYNAVNNLALVLDAYTGNNPVTSAQYEDQRDVSSLRVGLSKKLYRQCGEALTAYCTVELRADGKLYKGTQGKVIGFVSAAYAVDAWAFVWLEGIAATSGLTAGTLYAAHPSTAGSIVLNSAIATGTQRQVVGRALTATTIHINPQIGMTTNGN